MPDALLLNQRATRFVFLPDPASGKVMVASDPPAPGLHIENHITASARSCNGSQMPDMRVATGEKGTVVEFVGNYALDCGTRDLYRVVAEPQDMLLGAFRSLWQELGGSFSGSVRIAPTPEAAKRFDRIDSRPLAEVIRPMNKWSSNVMTRQVLLTLSAEQFGPPGNPEKGQRAIEYWLGTQGFQWPEFVLGNGSGLSRESRISARHMGELLLQAYASPYMPEFIASLPVAGVEGTVRKRMKGEDIAGRAHLKTGTLNGVRAIAGYVLTRSGRRYAVVVLHNAPGVQNGIGSKVQDALLKWVYELQ
ncbi:MAG TPA: D-alanyl-D-alanine carboxypeptidase/D-alanyl-D-alanine-endopeptidase [Chromatiales bacterium]|nr:D-alanyl-D-alanine carboxypeptidase/D-alanyl-D-alanine-endopeptidase [Chromatiales bacterium]